MKEPQEDLGWSEDDRRRLAGLINVLPDLPAEKIMENLARVSAANELALPRGSGWDAIWRALLLKIQIGKLGQWENVTLEQVKLFVCEQYGFPRDLTARELGERYGKFLYTLKLRLPEDASWEEIAAAYQQDIDVRLGDTATLIHADLLATLQLSSGVSLVELKAAAFGSSVEFDALLRDRKI